MRRLVISLTLCALFSLASSVQADCAVARISLGAAIATGTRLPIGAPIVVVPGNDFGRAGSVVRRELVGARTVALAERTIAPDVTVLVPATTPTPGIYEVTGLRAPLSIEYTTAPMPHVLGAPVLRSAAFSSLGIDRHSGERSEATATLGTSVPTDALLVIARWWVSGRPAGTSFAVAEHSATTQRIFVSAEGCGTLPGSVVPPPVGAQADIAWVDIEGRVSPWSARVPVTR